MALFSKSQQPLIGIDITETSVKVIQLSKNGTRFSVDHYAVEPLPLGAVNENIIKDVDKVSEVIRKAIKLSGTKSKWAAAAVADAHVISKMITMPAGLTEAELEAQVELEAPNYIPYPIDEVSLDFLDMGLVPNNNQAIQVLLTASRVENVEQRQTVLELAGLSAKIVDVEGLAVERAFHLIKDEIAAEPDSIIALFDLGATTTNLNVMVNGKMVYTREQAFGGKQLTDEIMRRFGLGQMEAEMAKRNGGLPESYDIEVLDPFIETVVQQISRLLQFFYAGTEYNKVDGIVLSGGTASLVGMVDRTEEQMGVKTILANPLNQMTLGKGVDAHQLAQVAPSLMIATGLALRGIE